MTRADHPARTSAATKSNDHHDELQSKGAKLAGQFGWVSGGRLVGALIQAATLVLLARWAGPSGFGAAGVALAIVVILQTVTDLGLPTYVIRERAARPENPTIRRALQLNNVTARWMSFLLILVFGALAAFSEPVFLQLLPMAIWAAADRNTDTWLGVTLADGDARINTMATLSRRVTVILAMTALYAAGIQPLLAFSIALAVVGVTVNRFVHSYIMHRLDPSDDRPAARPILRASYAFWITSTATQLRNLDTLIVGVITGTSQVAFYAAASKITGPLRILPTSLATVLVPAAARLGILGLRPIRKPIGALLAAMVAIYGAVIVAAPYAVPLALGQGFAEAVLPVQIVCAGLIFAASASILTAILQGVGRGKSVARIAVMTTALCLAGVLIGTTFLGAIGAAVALSASFLVQAASLAWVLRRARRNFVMEPVRTSATRALTTQPTEGNQGC